MAALMSSSTPMALAISIPNSKGKQLSTCSILPFKTSHSFCSWNGLSQFGFSISISTSKSFKPEKKGRSTTCKGKVVYASLFGVGAPEALVIGVVALLVFGPKGLAEVARNLGKTLREFQPTIRELQDVSREFKSTLQREIGLDDISLSSQNAYTSNTTKTTPTSTLTPEDSEAAVADFNGGPSPNRAYNSEEYLKITEEQLKAFASQQQGQTSSSGENQLEVQNQPQGPVQDDAAAIPPPSNSEKEA